jgi:hypothetical protein
MPAQAQEAELDRIQAQSTSELSSEATPQPPLIDAQPVPSYEPQTTSTTDSSNDAESIDTDEDTTPQPPLIDAQPEPSYEPDKSDTSKTEDNTDQIQVDNTDTTEEEKKSTRWLDTRPERVSADWMQLISGEWLRGRIISMQQDKLVFDSDELDYLEIDWYKVKYLKSHEPYSLRFDDRVTATGAIEITQDKVFVDTDYDDQEFDRRNLLIIASGRETEISLWTSKITFSINVRKGNTDQTDFTSKINASRRTLESRLVIDYLGNFTEIENAETINNHRLNGTYDLFITRNFFWTLLSAEFFRDPFQNIEKRFTGSTALGYTLINNNETEWDVSAGPGYQETKFVSVQQGSNKDSAITLILSTKFDTELNSKVDLEGHYTVTLGDDKTGNYTHHSVFTVETELTKRLDFDVSIVWDHVRSPVADENNVVPEQDDFRFLIGLGYDL